MTELSQEYLLGIREGRSMLNGIRARGERDFWANQILSM